jgi:hypothetical protein
MVTRNALKHAGASCVWEVAIGCNSARVSSGSRKGFSKVGRTFKILRGHPIRWPEVWLILDKASDMPVYVKIALCKQHSELLSNENRNSRRPGQILNDRAPLEKGRVDRHNSDGSMEEDEPAHHIVRCRSQVFR